MNIILIQLYVLYTILLFILQVLYIFDSTVTKITGRQDSTSEPPIHITKFQRQNGFNSIHRFKLQNSQVFTLIFLLH